MKEIGRIKKLEASLTIPGSKSYTQRSLVAAALARGTSRLRYCLDSEDTGLLTVALRSLGADIETFGEETIVRGTGGKIHSPEGHLFLGNNGTGMRFLVAVASLGRGAAVIDGDVRLRERPVKPLLDAIRSVGGKCVSAGGDDYPPVINYGGGLKGGTVFFRNSESSQYISSLLMAAPYAENDVSIELQGRVLSRPYIDMTLEVMRHFGAVIEEEGGCRFRVSSGRTYEGRNYTVAGDASSASYFFLAAALCSGKIRIENLDSRSRKGDLGILDLLEEIGCSVRRGDDFTEVEGRFLAGGERIWDLSSMPDMVPGLAVLAAFRPGRTIITNVPHLRIKESDRLAAMAAELSNIGVEVQELPEGLVIEGGNPRGGTIHTYRDHRIAMSFAVAGLATGNMKIEGENCVQKSFPTFWDVLEDIAL